MDILPTPNGHNPETKLLYLQSDMGNARRFADRYGGKARYVHGRRQWLIWDGTRWKPDNSLQIMRLAKECARDMYHSADDGWRISESEAKWALQCQNRDKLNAMIALAESEPEFSTHPTELDRDPYLINCLNCTVDLRTGVSRPHAKEDLITRRIECDYTPGAIAKHWQDFLWRVLGEDPDLELFIRKAIGYSLTGVISEQIFLFLFGHGANGKSTFIEAIMRLFSDYSTKLLTDTLMRKEGGDNVGNSDIAALQGIRLCFTEETEQDRRMNEALVKKLTGGDTIRARLLYGEPFDFQPTHKLWMFGNHKPTIRGTDKGIWRRVKLVPFTVTIPESERDPDLPRKLETEAAGILNWALSGARLWFQEGLRSCAAVDNATAEYQTEMDVIGDWLSLFDLDPKGFVSSSIVKHSWQNYGEENGIRAMMPYNRLSIILKERGFVLGKNGAGVRGWFGFKESTNKDL